MTRLAGIDIALPPLLVIPGFLLALLLLAGLAARLVHGLAGRWLGGPSMAPGSERRAMPRGRLNLGVPIATAVLAAGVQLVLPELGLPERLARWSGDTLTVLLVLACALASARIAVAGVTEYAVRNPSVTPALGVVRVATRVVIGVLALLMTLQSLGVPVAPLLTTLGIGSLAVALALQDTLANFFAGLHLLADRPVRSGDYIKINDGGEGEGYVEAIGWRSARLRTLKNNTIIVPNQKLSQAILTNFNLPSPVVSLSIPLTISYDADADAVERLLLDELARAAPGIAEVHGTDAAVRLSELAESGMVFSCVVSVRDFESQGRAAHELRKRLLARLRQEGIEIPYPQRVVHSAPPRDRG